MHKKLSLLLVILSVVLAGCGALSTPAPTQTAMPTYTPYPTYTAVPTATSTDIPVPTLRPTVAPTDIPVDNDEIGGYLEIDCPSSITPDSGEDVKCYLISVAPLSLGMTYSSYGRVIGIGVTWKNGSANNVLKAAATFVTEQAMSAGWNISDLLAISDKMSSIPENTKYTYRSLAVTWNDNGEYTTIAYGLSE